MGSHHELNNSDRLESPLREAVESVCVDVIPEDIIEASINRALLLATTTAASRKPRPQLLDQRTKLTTVRRWSILTACATVLLAVIFFWSYSDNSVLADVIKAVANQSWMRASGKGLNDTNIEIWFSPKDGIIAMHQWKDEYKEIIYVNVPQNTIEAYNVEGGKPYLAKMPIPNEQKSLLTSQGQMLKCLFFGNPSQAFSVGQQELISHTKKTVLDGDATYLEYRLTAKTKGNAKPVVTTLRVDPKTQLPVAWKSVYGNAKILSCKVEYPSQGPQSIFAMGVPSDIKIVDQTPNADLEQIQAAWKTGRTRFDSYRAVVVESFSADDRADGSVVYQVWRKGTKWRIEHLRWPPNANRSKTAVPANADPKSWWLARGLEWEAIPESVSDGSTQILLRNVYAEPRREDPKNPDYYLIESVKISQLRPFYGYKDDPHPCNDMYMPEYLVYPILAGRGGWSYKTTVDSQATHGPEGAVLVEHLDINPSEKPGRPCGWLYWADPTRGYAVRQVQYLKTGQAKDAKKGLVEMQSFALSPSGIWYPTVVRRVNGAKSLDSGKYSDVYTRFYLDFETEIPDELFNVDQWEPID